MSNPKAVRLSGIRLLFEFPDQFAL